ncbi:helix-turn-helix domain-containing protein [Nostoc sp.]
MKTNNNKLTAFPMEVKIIPTQSEQIIDQASVPKSKPDFKTKEEKQQHLATLAEDTRRRPKRSAIDIYYIGLNLLEAQNITEHDEFIAWLRQEFGMGKTSAYKFIYVAKAFKSKIPILGNLINNITLTALYKLAAPSTPEAARDEAIDILKAGEVLKPDVVKNLIKKYRIPKTVKKEQYKASLNSPQRYTNQLEASVLPKTKVGHIEQTTSNFMPLSSTPQQDELQKLTTERDTYKVQLEALQIKNEELKLYLGKFCLELTVLQTDAEILKFTDPKLVFQSDPQMSQVFSFIEANFHQPITLLHVAQAIGYSRAYLTSLVRCRTGKTVQNWIIWRRMKAACFLLLETSEGVEEIAAKVGYQCAVNFFRQFRQHYGTTPHAWRIKNRTLHTRTLA